MSEYETELEKVREELKRGLDSKRHRIMDLVKILEGLGTKKDRIASRIAHDLEDVVGKSWVYETLPDEYKTETKPKKKIPLVESHSSIEQIQEDGTVLLGGGPSLDDPEVKERLEEYKKTRDENKLLQDRIEELQIKWKSICPEHQRAITDCAKCGEKDDAR